MRAGQWLATPRRRRENFCASASRHLDLEDPARGGAVMIGPARMNAGVAGNQCAVVEFQPMRIAGTGLKVIGREYLAGLAVILDQPGLAFLVAFGIVAGDLPDIAVGI